MPYPLPDGGPPYTADLRWFLVAVPDDVAFVRAAMGAYTELTKYYKWGHEGKEPGRNEAAQVWETAVAATLEALEMGFPDILLGYIDGVEGLLQQLILKDVCCGSETPGGGLPQTDYGYEDGDPVPQNVIDAGYATDVNDQAGMTAYKCMISHLYVQNVAAKLNEYAKYFDNAGDMTLSVAGVAAIAAALFIGAAITGFIALPLIGIEMLLGIGAAAGIFGALGELGESALQDAANELVVNADDYVCAIYLEDGPAAGYDAFSALVTTNMSAAMAALIDLIAGLQDLASLYTGRYADSDIAGELAAADYDPADFECSCEVIYDFDITWDPTIQAQRDQWFEDRAPYFVHALGSGWFHNPRASLSNSIQSMLSNTLQAAIGETGNITVALVEVGYVVLPAYEPKLWTVEVRYADATTDSFPGDATNNASGTLVVNPQDKLARGGNDANNAPVAVRGLHNGSSANTDAQFIVTHVRIAGYIE